MAQMGVLLGGALRSADLEKRDALIDYLQLTGYTYSMWHLSVILQHIFPLAVSQAAHVLFFLSETINDLTFGAGVSYISLTHTPGSAQGKLPVFLAQGG